MIDTKDRLDFKYPYDLPASNLPFLFSQQKQILWVKNSLKIFSWISINSKFENQRSKKLLNWEKSLKQIKRKLKGWNKIENSSQWRHESYYLTKTYIFMRSLFTLGCMAKLTFGRKQVKWFLSQSNFGIFIS